MSEMTIDERLRLPCGICGKQRSQHIGRVFACPQGYGTSWSPEGKRDERVWPVPSPEPPRSLADKAKDEMTDFEKGYPYEPRQQEGSDVEHSSDLWCFVEDAEETVKDAKNGADTRADWVDLRNLLRVIYALKREYIALRASQPRVAQREKGE